MNRNKILVSSNSTFPTLFEKGFWIGYVNGVGKYDHKTLSVVVFFNKNEITFFFSFFLNSVGKVEFEETKWVIRIRKSKIDRKYNCQMKEGQRDKQ
jgi:hypothetical protein